MAAVEAHWVEINDIIIIFMYVCHPMATYVSAPEPEAER